MGTILHLPQAKTLPGSVIHPETYPDNSRQTCLLGRPLTYLACPYTHPLPAIMESRFETCTRAAAWLIQEQEWNVFSPITHSHPMATIGGCRADWNSWAQIDREYLECSRRLVVLCLPGWSTSVGVTAEIRIAESQGLSILYLKMDGPGWRFIKVSEAVDGLVVSPGAQEASDSHNPGGNTCPQVEACRKPLPPNDGAPTSASEAQVKMRQFDTGATRDTDQGKLDFEAFLSPLVLEAFGRYMHQHRIQPDGSLRDGDNWQKGIPLTAYMKSLWRHFFDLWKLHRKLPCSASVEEAACAALFNVMGYLHETLKASR